ncbi:hypothetical protein KJ819_02085 [Patescibacteria group bacterium]|nr:hypothetical protein [Patescibacteria group bacterium]MBU1500927.1 hypothetical protein [Patescibacteria group bacterium]MBU2080558.1 hypothetical protein [Patescibacteria group bacterium]MBU2124366.1 hypothetical protein [Patescibacteria group bacterium]MBU2194493.1 hypothetical protein [Patescibacteria group bacterium]
MSFIVYNTKNINTPYGDRLRSSSMRIFLAVAALFFFALAGEAHAQYNPYRPSPQQRYPICTDLDANRPIICTANPDLQHTRLECALDQCPEDNPIAYDRQRLVAFQRTCGPTGRLCVGGFVESADGWGDRCIRRIVANGGKSPNPVLAQFEVDLTWVLNGHRLQFTLSNERDYARYQRNYERQLRDQYNDYFRGTCRWG